MEKSIKSSVKSVKQNFFAEQEPSDHYSQEKSKSIKEPSMVEDDYSEDEAIEKKESSVAEDQIADDYSEDDQQQSKQFSSHISEQKSVKNKYDGSPQIGEI